MIVRGAVAVAVWSKQTETPDVLFMICFMFPGTRGDHLPLTYRHQPGVDQAVTRNKKPHLVPATGYSLLVSVYQCLDED